jgi:MFS transporter, MHS family, proline/betaine transporter
MEGNPSLKLNKVQKFVLLAISIGNILEAYDIYLYIFWAPTLSLLFFEQGETSGLFSSIALFAIGFIFRPLGGLFFGRIGDRIGRKKAFILSLIFLAIPTFLTGFVPTYSQIGIFAPILLVILRILQIFPSGGELPGAFCYLYENAGPGNKKFMSSFAGVGNQIGIALAVIECFLLKTFFSEESLSDWGWRLSFIVGGFIGLGGFFLRYKLHETKLFEEIAIHHKVAKEPLLTIIGRFWQKLLRGFAFGAAQTISFHFITILFPIYFFQFYRINDSQGLLSTLIFLIATTIPLPIFGLLAEKYGVKRLAIGSCLLMLCLLYPIHYSIHFLVPAYTLTLLGLFTLCLTCLTALWPYFLTHLFSTRVRYTCVGLSFNISDGVLGGLSSLFALYFLEPEKNLSTFIWMASISCILSIISCLKISLSEDRI